MLRERTILVLTLMFCVGIAGTFWHLWELSSRLVRLTALEGTSAHAYSLEEVRTVYTSEVVERLQGHGVTVAHDYASREGAIPLPVTFSMELGRRIGEGTPGMRVRLYSDRPFPWRADGGPRDAFEAEALRRLTASPERPFYRFEVVDGRPSLRYATADRMRAACVPCHNSHPDSPRRDWKVGDVRGVLEVITPLDRVAARTRTGLQETLLLMSAMAVLAVSGLGLGIGRLRRTNTELMQALQSLGASREQIELQRDELAHVARVGALGQLTAALAHELNQPLAAIRANAQATRRLLAAGRRPDDLDEALGDIASDAARAADLIRRLRDLLRRREMEKIPVDVNRVIQDVEPIALPEARRHEARLALRLAPDLPRVAGDAVQLQQVLLNLVRNAGEAMTSTPVERREIVVRTSAGTEAEVTVAVEDAGPPVDPATLGAMFTPFHSTKPEGLGMGLAISRSIVEAHGGRLWAERREAGGLAVRFTLPATREPGG
jgi:signal transduction histidine kinase